MSGENHSVWFERSFVLCGPTAAGKSALAIDVARRCGAEIVSIDAFQCYRGLSVLTAAPTEDQLHSIPHHLVGNIPLDREISSGHFRTMVADAASDILLRGKLPLLVGGNGHYLDMLCNPPTKDIPGPDAGLRQELEKRDTADLLDELDQRDPLAGGKIDRANRRRIIRALETCILTGIPYSTMRADWTTGARAMPRNGITIHMPREELSERITRRVEWMLQNGAIDEVASARNIGSTASKALGFRQIKRLLDGEMNMEDCRNEIALKTRQYAKRQLTWFRNKTAFPTLDMSEIDADTAATQIAGRAARTNIRR